MEPKIITIQEKKLIGSSVEMSLQDNKTFELFSGFMPNKKQINNTISSDIFEVMDYDDAYFKNFNPKNTFIKRAALEVDKFENIPQNMNSFSIEPDLYAVFQYKGLAKDFSKLMQYIFTEWLPKSGYFLDNRPHFNVLGDKYKKDSPDSEEDVYIPIKKTP